MPYEHTPHLATLYRIVAATFLPPEEGARAAVLGEAEAAREAAREVGPWRPLDGVVLHLERTFAAVTEGELMDEHRRVFGGAFAGEYPVFESRWLGAAGGGEASGPELAGLYRSWGLRDSAARTERLDHITTELEFAGFLAWRETAAAVAGEREHALTAREARRRFHEQHLGRWAASFAARLRRGAGYGPYLAAARALGVALLADARSLAIAPPSGGQVRPAPHGGRARAT
jgi:TorA maturation chaperone TorD